MFDIWIGDVNLAWLVIGFSLALLPLQLLLCFRARPLSLRLAPGVLLLALTALSGACCLAFTGTARLAYAALALFGAYLTLVCAAGWGVWLLTRRIKNR